MAGEAVLSSSKGEKVGSAFRDSVGAVTGEKVGAAMVGAFERETIGKALGCMVFVGVGLGLGCMLGAPLGAPIIASEGETLGTMLVGHTMLDIVDGLLDGNAPACMLKNSL